MPRLSLALPIVLALAALCLAVPAEAADPMYTVSNVHVAAAAASAGEAQSIAFTQGRPRAWQTLYRRLTRQQDWAKQPQLDDTALQRIVRNFSVKNERRSTTRYEADISYDFNPAAVAKILKQANVAFAQGAAKRILLIPMNPTFSKTSAWTHAFTAPRFADAVVPFALPIGDALDAEALGNLTIDRASWMDIEPIAQRAHTNEAVLVLAAPNNGKLTLTLKRVGAGEAPTSSTVDVPYVQGVVTTYPSAADAALSAIADLWKQKSAVDFSQKGKLIADVRISSLSQWANVQAALASVPNVESVSIVAMNIGEARVQLGYLGTPDQLKDALGQASLLLDQIGGTYVLRQGTPPQPTPGTTASQ
jgi:hypothetical protein